MIDNSNKELVTRLVKDLHLILFSEEYDYMFDSLADIEDRKRGINPMNIDYINSVNKKRIDLGVDSLSENGMTISNQSMNICFDILDKLFVGDNTKFNEKVLKYVSEEDKEKLSSILAALS
jgi:hypothetical protein